MIVKTYQNAGEFLDKAQGFLELNEAANNLMLGLCFQLDRHPDRVKTLPYFITIEADGVLAIAAVMTPAPQNSLVRRSSRS